MKFPVRLGVLENTDVEQIVVAEQRMDCPCLRKKRCMKYVQSFGVQGKYLRVKLGKMRPSNLSTLPEEKSEGSHCKGDQFS